MANEKYWLEIPEEGMSNSLDILFNKTTQEFISHSGLKPGMHVLDIGCGTGAMSVWLSKQVGETGSVLGIDNDEHQVKAAEKYASSHGAINCSFKLQSAYEISKLKQNFDFIYCRFILHHLFRPTDVIKAVYEKLPSGGIFVAEEGILSSAFTYPFSDSFGERRWQNYKNIEVNEGEDRNINFGMLLYNKMFKAGFQDLKAHLVQPVLCTKEEKKILIINEATGKKSALESGMTLEEWNKHMAALNLIMETEGQFVAFYQSCQVSGKK